MTSFTLNEHTAMPTDVRTPAFAVVETAGFRMPRRFVAALLIVLLGAPVVQAQPADAPAPESPDQRGLEIAREVDRRDAGFDNLEVELTMVLRNRHGQESTRRLTNHILEVEGDGDKSLIVFHEPHDVKGTAFLSFTHATGPDDQWLYLPALKRVKRIASDNKSGPFMGSEFAYEDIASAEIEKYTYRYVGEEEMDGTPAVVIERVPVDEKSGYTKQVVWYDRARYIPLKIDFYDRKAALLKTLTYHGYRQYLDRYWRADRFEMVNHQTGKSTTLHFDDYQFQVGLNERDFNKASLRRAR